MRLKFLLATILSFFIFNMAQAHVNGTNHFDVNSITPNPALIPGTGAPATVVVMQIQICYDVGPCNTTNTADLTIVSSAPSDVKVISYDKTIGRITLNVMPSALNLSSAIVTFNWASMVYASGTVNLYRGTSTVQSINTFTMTNNVTVPGSTTPTQVSTVTDIKYTDQYGATFTPSTITTPTYAIVGTAPQGVTINHTSGAISMDNTACPTGTGCTVTVRATNNGKTKDFTISYSRGVSIPTTLSFSMPAVTISPTGSVTSTPTNLQVYDQYGVSYADRTGLTYAFTTTPPAGVTINATTGVVSVANTVTNGSILVRATVGTAPNTATNTATLNYTRQPSTATTLSLTLSGTSPVAVPYSGSTLQKTATPTLLDQYGTAMTGRTFTYAVNPAHTGVSVNSSGIVTVTPLATDGDVIIEVTDTGSGKTATATFKLTKETPKAKTITFTMSPSPVVIPTSGSVTSSPTNLVVKDQYGVTFPSTGISYALSSPSTGVSIEASTGKVTIDSTAVNGFEMVTATLDSVTAEAGVMFNRAVSVPTKVVTSLNKTELAVPFANTSDTSIKASAVMLDQYGVTMTGKTFTYAVNPAYPGVIVDKNTGVVTVTPVSAQGTVTIEATNVQTPTLKGTNTFKLTKHGAIAKTVSVLVKPTTLKVPTLGNKVTGITLAQVRDQYNANMSSESLLYEISPVSEGVTIDSATGDITVDHTAQAGPVNIVVTDTSNLRSKAIVEGSATLTITKDAPYAASMYSILTPSSVRKPATGTTSTSTASVYIADQYGENIQGKTVTYSIPPTQGVTINGKIITVDSTASEGSVVVTASMTSPTTGQTFTSKETLLISSLPPVPTTVEATVPQTTLAVPYFGNTATTKVTGQLKDQYGVNISGATYTYSLETAETGISINSTTGDITITPMAAAQKFRIIATSNGISGYVEITLTKEASVATIMKMSLSPNTLRVPLAGQTNSSTIDVIVDDQYGNTMLNPTVTYSSALPSGVSLNGDVITVDETVALGDIIVSASSGSATATAKLTISDAPSKATYLILSLDKPAVSVPTVGNTETVVVTSEVLDQYTDIMSGLPVTYAIKPAVEGVTLDANGNITIASTVLAEEIVIEGTSGTLIETATIILGKEPVTPDTSRIVPKEGAIKELSATKIIEGEGKVINVDEKLEIYDQYGLLITPKPTIIYHIETISLLSTKKATTRATLGYPGVNIDEKGILTVTPEAPAGKFNVVATYGKSVIPIPFTITSKKDARPDPSKDEEVIGLIKAEKEAAARFAKEQLANANTRLGKLHGKNYSSTDINFAIKGNDVPLDSLTTGKRKDINFWTEGNVNFGENNADSGRKTDFTTYTFTVGADYEITPKFIVGAGTGYGNDVSTVGSKDTKVDGDSKTLMAYSTYTVTPQIYFDTIIGYNWLEFDTKRYVTPDPSVGVAQGTRKGNQLYGAATIGYEYRDDLLMVTPYTRIDTVYTTLDEEKETSGGDYALVYGKESYNNYTSYIGIRTSYDMPFEKYTVVPNAQLEWGHDFKGSSDSNLGYADMNSLDYKISNEAEQKDYANIGFGFDVRYSNGTSIGGMYKHQVGEIGRTHTVGATLGMRF